jgi:hypothetical protein
MLASSQGDSSFHFFLIGRNVQHLGSFCWVGDTDGITIPVPLGKRAPRSSDRANGEAPEPPDTGDITTLSSTAQRSSSTSISGCAEDAQD